MAAHAYQPRTSLTAPGLSARAASATGAPAAPASSPRAKHLKPDGAMLRAALEAAGVSERQLAERMHLSRARVGQWLDGAAALSLERIEAIAAACPTLGRELARRAVDRLAHLLDAPTHHQDLARHLRVCTAELDDVARTLDEALADGHVTALEQATLRRELRQLADALDAMRRAIG